MNQQEHRTSTDRGRTVHPVSVVLISALYSTVTMGSVTTLAVLVGIDELLAQPPQLAGAFVAVFVGGMVVATSLHFLLLAWLRGGRPWPLRQRIWWRFLGTFAGILVTCSAYVVIFPWSLPLVLLEVAMLIAVAISLLPTLVCLLDFLQYQITRLKERVRLVPLALADLPRTVRAYFDSHTSELLQDGFQLLGDYRLKQHTPTFGRFFLNPGGDTFAEINHTHVFLLPIRMVCFFSLTPDGFYLESSNMRFFGKRPVAANFELQHMPGKSILEVYQQHQRRLRQVDHGRPRSLAVEDLEPVIWYGNKRLYEFMIAQGRAGMNPYVDFDDMPLLPEAVEWQGSEPCELAGSK